MMNGAERRHAADHEQRPGPSGAPAPPSDLLDAILALPDRGAAERFLRDLCTLRELHDMAQRWQVVRCSTEGLPYAEISRETGASTATITRIAQWLHHGTGGYREALARRRRAAQEPGTMSAQTATRGPPAPRCTTRSGSAWPSPTRAGC